MPPAVQIEISPRPAPRCCNCLASVPTMRVPVAANGWPSATLPPRGLSLARSIAPSARAALERRAAIVVGLPCRERAQNLRGEGFVNLVDVEVLQRDAGAIEHRRHGVGRRHQQALRRTVDAGEIDRRDRPVRQIRLHREPARLGPRVGREQHAGRAVGQRRAVARGERARGAPVVHRLQRRELVGVVSARTLLSRSRPRERHDQVVIESAVPRGGGVHVTSIGQLVLLGAADAPFLGHQLAMLAHRKAGARFDDARRRRLEVAPACSLEPRRIRAPPGPAARAVERDAVQGSPVADRHVAGRVDAAGDAGLDFAQGDPLTDLDRSRETGAAGALDVVGGRVRVQTGAERGFARQIPVARMLDHRAGRDFAQLHASQPEALDQRRERRGQHFRVAGVDIRGCCCAQTESARCR